MPAVRPGTQGAIITGWGTAVPDEVVTNHDLAKRMDTSDEWIRTRTGIEQRYRGGTTAGLSVTSATQALEHAGIAPGDIDGLILATATPDKQWGTAALIQDQLGLTCGALDVNAACSGFAYGLVSAHGWIAMGAQKVLLIGTDTLHRIVDQNDRTVAPLFGNASGAVVLEAVDGPGQMVSWNLGADGSLLPILECEVGGLAKMEGKEVFRRAVRLMVDSANASLADAGMTIDDIALVIPHQANIRIIEAACQRLGAPMDRTAVVIERYGNTSSASIPLTLADALDNGRINDGDHILLVGFGGGMTTASCVLKWGGKHHE